MNHGEETNGRVKAGLVMPKPKLKIYFFRRRLSSENGQGEGSRHNSSKCFLYYLASFFYLSVLSGLSSAGKGKEIVLL